MRSLILSIGLFVCLVLPRVRAPAPLAHSVLCNEDMKLVPETENGPVFVKRSGSELNYAKPVYNRENAEKPLKLQLEGTSELIVACPGANNVLLLNGDSTNVPTLHIQCGIVNTRRTFVRTGDGQPITVGALRCKTPVKATTRKAEEVDPKCSSYNAISKEIGFEIEGTFFSLIDACHDEYIHKTLYTVHFLTPNVLVRNEDPPRPSEGIHNENYQGINQVLEKHNLEVRTTEFYGIHSAYKLLESQKLKSSLLAPPADFLSKFEVEATHIDVNQVIVTVNEENMRKVDTFAKEVLRTSNEKTIVVITGVHDVGTWQDWDNKSLKPLTLSESGEKRTWPVSKFLWKVLKLDTGCVGFYIENLVYTGQDGEAVTPLCKNVCEEVGFNSPANVHCCNVPDLRQIVQGPEYLDDCSYLLRKR